MSGAAEMRRLIRRWESSGLSQRAFAEQEGVSYSAFQYWRRRLQDDQADPPKEPGIHLAPVRVVAGGPRGSVAFELRTARGLTLSVPAGFDEDELRRLLDVLTGC